MDQVILQEHLTWALDSFARLELQHRRGPSQEFILPAERSALYARRLVRHFALNRRFISLLVAGLRRHRKALSALPKTKGHWDQDRWVITLDDALHLHYDGLATLESMHRLWDDVQPQSDKISGLGEALHDAQRLPQSIGLDAPWAGPMILGAWLRYLSRRRYLPRQLRSFDLWPSGSRTETFDPPRIQMDRPIDYTGWTKAEILSAATEFIKAQLEETTQAYRMAGFEPFEARNVDRDVAATYLRLSDPRGWTWRALHEYFVALGEAPESSADPDSRHAWVRRAVGRVLTLLSITAPARGHRRRTNRDED